MNKIFYIAGREFAATVMTKGFIIGMLIVPLVIGLAVVVMPRMMNRPTPKITGEIAIVDPTGEVTAVFRNYLSPEQFVKRRDETRKQVADATPEAVKNVTAGSPQAQAAMQHQIETALGEVPQIDVVALEPATDLERAKAPLKTAPAEKDGSPSRRLALIVVHPDVVRRAEGADRFGTYDLFVRGKLDDRLVDDIHNGMREAIVDARVKLSGMNRSEIEALTRVKRPESRTVTAEGERTTNQAFNVMLPAAFMFLVLMAAMTSGQYLLTTTVEEKSNRVVEVLLSAVSPLELMTGKILGEMAVGLLVLSLYAGLGIVALVSFAMLGLLDPVLIIFLLVFFVLAYCTWGALMAAIGSAVNEMREAQTLLTPLMLLIMVPWILWMPISREPNSALAVVLSFIPPVGNFVMLLRMTSTAPPPAWQVALAITVGAAGAAAAVWFAAKVFRIGLLMFGKPPSFGTLVRWVRMA